MHAARMVREAERKISLECYKNENKLRSTEDCKKRDQGKIQWDLSLKNIRTHYLHVRRICNNNILAWARFLKSQTAKNACLLIWREKRLQVIRQCSQVSSFTQRSRLRGAFRCQKSKSRHKKKKWRVAVKLRICRVVRSMGAKTA